MSTYSALQSPLPARPVNGPALAAGNGASGGTIVGGSARYRIAFAIQRYFEFGGLQRSMLRVAKACAALGHQVTVLTSEWRGEFPSEFEVRRLDARALTNHGAARKFGQAVRKCIRSENFDCIVGFSRMQRLDVYWCGDPCLDDAMGDWRGGLFRWFPRYYTYLKLERSVMRRGGTTELLVLCPQELERLSRCYHTEASRMHLLPPGIDLQRLKIDTLEKNVRAEIRREFGMAEDEFIFLSVGSRFHTKGIDRSVRALAHLSKSLRRKAALIVVGQGCSTSFQRLARRLGIADRVYFAGGRHDVARFYHAADILLHPARTETAGRTILEAMICGLPVLVTANCGYAYHVEKAQAGGICPMPFKQQTLNDMTAHAMDACRRREWQRHAQEYCEATDMVGMVDAAVKTILARAAANRRHRTVQAL